MEARTLGLRRVAPDARGGAMRLFSGPPLVAATAVLLLIGATARWLAVDSQVPDYDSAKHLLFSWDYADHFGKWDLAEPITAYTSYPPVLHLVGAVATLIAGKNVAPPILGVALVFAPLLVIGVYRAGALLGNPWTGALAAVFVIGTPMIVTEFRGYMTEIPATALLAIATWLLIAGRRFERRGVAVLAGVVVGLGLLAKPTFGFFVAGLVGMLVLRGGWRNRSGLLAFAVVAALIAAPWYLIHWEELKATEAWATGPGSEGAVWTERSLAYYAWSFLNRQFMLPLAVLFLVGAAAAFWRFLRHPSADDHTPELIAGLLCGWIALTFYLRVKAPYYGLPLTVYVALLATTSLAFVSRWRVWAVSLTIVATVNFVVVAFHVGNPAGAHVDLPEAREPADDVQRAGRVTLVSAEAWPTTLDPGANGDVLELMRALRQRGVRTLEFDLTVDLPYFNPTGLTAFARIAGLRRREKFDPFDPLMTRGRRFDPRDLRPPHEAFLGRYTAPREQEGPCRELGDGSTIFVTIGPPDTGRHICPAP